MPASATTYTFDPRHPVPTVGGNISSNQGLMTNGGYDQRPRDDTHAAVDGLPRILDQLAVLIDVMRGSKESRGFQETAWQFRRVINDEYAGPRLHAAIRASQTFMPRAFWLSYLNNHKEMLPFYEAETAAIHRHDPDGARAACDERSAVMARIMLGELVRRGVLRPPGAPRPATSGSAAPVAF